MYVFSQTVGVVSVCECLFVREQKDVDTTGQIFFVIRGS